MALPGGVEPPLQDMPPKQGYPQVRAYPVPSKRRIPGWALWAGGITIVTLGWTVSNSGARRRVAMQNETRDSRLMITAYLQAESDAVAAAQHRAAIQDEEALLRSHKDWKTGMQVYKSGIYVAPAINKGFPDDLIR